MFIARSDGTAFHQVNVGMIAVDPSYRAPLGDEIAFVGTRYVGDRDAIYAVRPDGSHLRPIVPADPVGSMNRPVFSPDGTLLTYNAWQDSDDVSARMHVMHADGTHDIVVDSSEHWNAGFAWSNDSKRLAMIRGYGSGFAGARMVAIPADGSGPGIEMQYAGDVEGACCSAWAWAPDDSVILGTTTDANGNRSAQVLWDPATGASKPTPWDSHSYPSHQRLAP